MMLETGQMAVDPGCRAWVFPGHQWEFRHGCARLGHLWIEVTATGQRYRVCSTHYGVAALRGVWLGDRREGDPRWFVPSALSTGVAA